jgi:hypothetical protein
VRRAAALLALLVIAGCGSGSGPLRLVRADPPAGATAAGKVAERQGSNNPDAGEPIYTLQPPEGSALSYSVTVRNASKDPVTVTGVVADKDRDGAFVPEGVQGAPVDIPAGATQDVVVTGHVRGCRFGGQKVPLAGPELKLKGDGSQQFDLGLQVELQTVRCGG